ncbi:MAG: ABC transporter permease, partial [Muribaculaceae bacterium]|nr:ABC transporter permease [Muribaculaceae bacterium]
LLLSIYLLMQKNKEKIRNLLLLGYSPLQVSRNYFMLIGLVNLIVLILSIMMVLVASHMWSGHFEMLGSEDSSCVLMVVVAFLMMSLITIGNFIAISQGVKKRFYD